jgi:hypothetical protein
VIWTSPHRSVLVVIDPEFGARLAQVPPGRPVWIARSAVNEPMIQAQWAVRPDRGSTKGITAFAVDPTASPSEVFMAILDAVDLHHGPHSNPDAPYIHLESFGAKLTPDIRAVLSGTLGFDKFIETETGFVAVRSDEAARRLRG